jgi:hypothetical protein
MKKKEQTGIKEIRKEEKCLKRKRKGKQKREKETNEIICENIIERNRHERE